jgi:diguanylate cyclase (GGDEF)-like protein
VSQTDYVLELREMKAGEVHRTESRITTANGTVSDILWHCSRLAVAANEAPSYLSVGMDITEHKKNEARIHNLAFYEPLTKLPNRRMLSDCVRHAMKSSARDHTHCALLFIDIDHFKAINDSKGQDVGDCLLVEIAKRLRLSLREFDTVAHLGGDEFVVLLEGLDQEVEQAVKQARSITENLRAKISLSCLVQELTYHLTSSVGVSLFRGDGEAGDEVFRHANIAMSHAKTSGRNTLRFFDPAMQISLEDRAELEADLYHALEDRQFELYYQVQTNSAGRAEGAEALIRWLHPQRGMVSPLNFIPIAEESDLMLSIGLWVLETACAQIKAWDANALSRDLQLAVNVSARQFQQPDFVTLVLRTLELSGANPDRLKLELTESLVLNDISDAVSKMQQLKKHGVRFSIDDFGTAYSSLSYLTQLPMDQLKIDQSFVRNIGVKPGDAIIVQTIIGMAKNLGMEVIAEGVETLAQLEFLGLAGCQNYQGYLFSKPLPLAAFNAYLATTQG